MRLRFITLAMLVAASSAWADSTFSLGTGFDYSSGKYGGTTSTNILYVPVVSKYETDNLTLKLTVPYIRVTSVGNVVRGFGMMGNSTSSSKTSTQSGLGDVIATAAYTVYDSSSLLFDVAANIKFGTASAQKGLGTGENDYSAQVDGYYSINSTTLFATLGHKIVGEPVGVVVNNVNYASAGISQKLDSTHNAGVMLDVAQSPTESNPATRELTLFMSDKLRKNLKLQANLMKGLSDASADYGFGVMLTGTF